MSYCRVIMCQRMRTRHSLKNLKNISNQMPECPGSSRLWISLNCFRIEKRIWPLEWAENTPTLITIFLKCLSPRLFYDIELLKKIWRTWESTVTHNQSSNQDNNYFLNMELHNTLSCIRFPEACTAVEFRVRWNLHSRLHSAHHVPHSYKRHMSFHKTSSEFQMFAKTRKIDSTNFRTNFKQTRKGHIKGRQNPNPTWDDRKHVHCTARKLFANSTLPVLRFQCSKRWWISYIKSRR